MLDRPQAVLRVDPNQLPALRAAFFEAHQTINAKLAKLRRSGQITEPWLGDPASRTVLAVYDMHVMNGPNSTFRHLESYRDELGRIYENLTAIEDAYRRSDSAAAAALLGERT